MPELGADRCQYTWNPGTWPYIKRCTAASVETIGIDGEETDDDEISLCVAHVELVLHRGGGRRR